MKKRVLITIVICIVATISSVVSWNVHTWLDDRSTYAAVAIADDFHKKVANNDYQKAYEMADPAFKATVSEEDFASSMKDLSTKKLKVETTNEVYKGFGDYLVQYNLVNEKGESSGSLTLFIYNLEGEWLFKDAFIS